jgi:thiol-disulfide isomerase/thioredoxin
MNPKLIVGALVIAIAAVAGFGVQRMFAKPPTVAAQDAKGIAEAAAVKREAYANTAKPEEAGDSGGADVPARRPVPETIPLITLPDRNGVTRTLTDWKGRPVLINFWATWCGPCREEIPLLKDLRHQRSRDRLEIVGIAIDQREDVLKYARTMGIDYPILIGDKDGYAAAEAFGVAMVLPFSVFADSRSRIVTLKVGELHADEVAFILDRVRDVDMKRLELAAARQQIADRLRELAVQRGHDHAAD